MYAGATVELKAWATSHQKWAFGSLKSTYLSTPQRNRWARAGSSCWTVSPRTGPSARRAETQPARLHFLHLSRYRARVSALPVPPVSAQAAAQARERLARLDPVIRALEDAGQSEDAAAVRLAKRLAERALGQQGTAPLTTRQAGRALG